ncbi:MAG TPA: ABC transporter ATP-binding protein [Vicinamibacterales bacterium]
MTVRLDVAIRTRIGSFSIDVAWSGGDGVNVLFGPSGSGKTLTLQCLAGLVHPDAGRIVLDGRVLFDAAAGLHVPPRARRVGYVFQGYALFPHLTVEDNVAFGLRERSRTERVRRTGEVVERLELQGLERRLPHELSGGQRQRVALGRALATEPALLLLDEPLSALDLPLRRALRDDLRTLLEGWNVPCVIVTHELSEAYQLADQIIVYERGRVLQAAPRGDLLWRPASEPVARILGFRNILRGVVVDVTPQRIHVQWRGRTLELQRSDEASSIPAAGTPVTFFIRPEDPRLLRKDGPPPSTEHHHNVLSGVVVDDEDFGATRRLLIRLDEPGEPAQGGYDLEIEVPRFVFQLLGIERDRHWEFSIHRSSIHLLPE